MLDFVGGVLRIAAAVVEEVADVVRLEEVVQAGEFLGAGFGVLELIAAGAKSATWGSHEAADGAWGLEAEVEEAFVERAGYAVLARQDFMDFAWVVARGFDDGAGRSIDDRGYATGLGVEGVFGHCLGGGGEERAF